MNTFADAAGIAGRQFEAPVLLKEGTRLLEPDVYRTLVKGRVAVVKDYSRYRRTPLAPLARLLVRREARALGRLRGWAHAPMLLGIVGGLALAMEFVPGEPLGAQRRVSEDTFRQLRDAVAHLHANGITHNDLHPANVMVSGDRVVLLDFASALRVPRWMRNAPVVRELRRSDLANALKIEQRLTGRAPGEFVSQVLADPRWVTAVRDGWKRFYRGFKATFGG
ncbi:kinase [Pseudoxanthomonas sp. SGNA-20]|uniref:RIO1 family regulatory kinase/ATPase domain-containing protein n=1 Tax=Pseudoxanthomonas sp. SGNA-20 TaxID=2493088 RepID=UPI000F6362FB|nr:phosphotransferase [Pseudoxanthomonas sp. SGNA-20]RRN59248.1 kinase [Pseudoxanthomonas sp. SGNA-20]